MAAMCSSFHISPSISIILLDDRVQIALRGPNGNDGLFCFMSEVVHSAGREGVSGLDIFRALTDARGVTHDLLEQIHSVVLETYERDAEAGIMPLPSYPEPAAIALWAFANRIVEAYECMRNFAWFCRPHGLYFIYAGAKGTDLEDLETVRAGPRFWTFYSKDLAEDDDSDDDVIIVEPLTKKSRPSPPESPKPDEKEGDKIEPDREPEPEEDELLKNVLETKEQTARKPRFSLSTSEILDELLDEAKNDKLTPHHPEEPKPEKAAEPDPVDVFMKMLDELEKKD